MAPLAFLATINHFLPPNGTTIAGTISVVKANAGQNYWIISGFPHTAGEWKRMGDIRTKQEIRHYYWYVTKQ
jgi:hypothetical protein